MNNNLGKDTLKWLRTYGYCLNSEGEKSRKLKEYIKEHYSYEYYFYIDLDIKRESDWRVDKKRIREYKKKQIKNYTD